jgi:hypothetical protein
MENLSRRAFGRHFATIGWVPSLWEKHSEQIGTSDNIADIPGFCDSA